MNQHQKLAIIMAPFLIVVGYIAADYYVQATSAPSAIESQALPLSLSKSCDLYKDICQLTQDDLGLGLSIQATSAQLLLSTNMALESVVLAFNSQQPQLLQQQDAHHWQMKLTENTAVIEKIRLVISIDQRHYFAEINLSSAHNDMLDFPID